MSYREIILKTRSVKKIEAIFDKLVDRLHEPKISYACYSAKDQERDIKELMTLCTEKIAKINDKANKQTGETK
jgi:hypothetical protein